MPSPQREPVKNLQPPSGASQESTAPQQLCYTAWQYPTWKETPRGDGYIPGDMDLPISELGIPHE